MWGYEGATGNTIQNHQVGYAPSSFYVYEQAYGVNENHLMEFISTETKMESLQNKTPFSNQQPIFFTVLIQA
jgi:hypothetical protein